jgi:hypothetical protein
MKLIIIFYIVSHHEILYKFKIKLDKSKYCYDSNKFWWFLTKNLAILLKTKVDNLFKAVSAERYSVSVRQNKVKKKNRTDFKVRRK